MVKMPTIEEYMERYVNSAGLAMWRNMRYWMRRSFRYEDSVKKAIPLGLGMLHASVGETISSEDAQAYMRNIAAAYIALADALEARDTDAS